MTKFTARYILIHSDKSTLDANDLDPQAHAFGPFDNYDAVVAFDQKGPIDTCYRFAIPLIGPEPVDMMITTIGLRAGVRPAAAPLPDRQPELSDEQRQALRLAKRLRKEAKRAAKAKRDQEAQS